MIRLVNVHRSFGPNHVLRGCSLDIRDGETLTIIGGSGTGKSVTLKLMVGLLKPNRGEIFVDDQEISHLSEDALSQVQEKFAYVFQGGALFDSLTVGQNVAFGLYNLKKMDRDKIPDYVRERLALVGLTGVEQLKPAELSGGMRKRVAIARAIAMAPKYLLYDEPTTGLDPIMSDVINDLIVGLQKKLGVTAVVVTHDMKSAFKVSNRIAMLYEGKIVGVDTPEAIRNSKDPLVQQFISGSAEGPIKMKVRAF
ncbi:MAG: ABC transporter ATP-binding protein [Elusimicrobia bacterium RIFCSPLOWO2_01_FULL_59_12]|nr:MAG: ABC transporter ATP-binding protein [Elusimicrobia bacterium RIFCSPLOWO2_01_FULL_59_12]